jgi:hypothetical protein
MFLSYYKIIYLKSYTFINIIFIIILRNYVKKKQTFIENEKIILY